MSRPYSFRLGSVILASLDLENMITLVFSGFSLILHLAHHIEGPVVKDLLQYVHLSCNPHVQYHQRTGIVSFVCGVVLEGR